MNNKHRVNCTVKVQLRIGSTNYTHGVAVALCEGIIITGFNCQGAITGSINHTDLRTILGVGLSIVGHL